MAHAYGSNWIPTNIEEGRKSSRQCHSLILCEQATRKGLRFPESGIWMKLAFVFKLPTVTAVPMLIITLALLLGEQFLVYLYFLWAELAAFIVNYWFCVRMSSTFFWWSFTTGHSGRGEQPCCCSCNQVFFLFETFGSLTVRLDTCHSLQMAWSCPFTHFLWKRPSRFKWNNLWLNQHWWLSSELVALEGRMSFSP